MALSQFSSAILAGEDIDSQDKRTCLLYAADYMLGIADIVKEIEEEDAQ